MYRDVYHRIVPLQTQTPEPTGDTGALLGATDQSKVEVYEGVKSIEGIAVTVEGLGSYASGHIEGDVTTHDWRALYQIYNIEEHQNANEWFIAYHKDAKHDELKKVFEQSQVHTFHYDVNYRLQGNQFGITEVIAGFTTVKLDYNGQTKLYTVTNDSSLKAMMPDGTTYPGGFHAV